MAVPIPYGFQLAAGRLMAGWSVADLAAKASVSAAMVKKAEASPGEADIPLPKVAAICGALNSAGVVFTRDMSRIGVALDLRRRA